MTLIPYCDMILAHSVTVALLIQALSFGTNCFNMAITLPFLGYFVYKFIKDRVKTETGEYVGMAVGAYAGINVAALCAAIDFGIYHQYG